MAVFTDRYDEKKELSAKKSVKIKTQEEKALANQRLFRINGSIVISNKHTSFTKEVRAATKSEALERAFKDVKDQYKVEIYQILVSSVKEGSM